MVKEWTETEDQCLSALVEYYCFYKEKMINKNNAKIIPSLKITKNGV